MSSGDRLLSRRRHHPHSALASKEPPSPSVRGALARRRRSILRIDDRSLNELLVESQDLQSSAREAAAIDDLGGRDASAAIEGPVRRLSRRAGPRSDDAAGSTAVASPPRTHVAHTFDLGGPRRLLDRPRADALARSLGLR
jgi:hypothetical protein